MSIYLLFPLGILVSLVYFVGTAVAIIQMPVDYFVEKRTSPSFKDTHILIWLLLKGLKNLIGLCLLLAGIVMLVTPGQGLLTILFGLFFIDFPRKKKLERRLIRHPSVHKSINWLRKKAGKEPIKIP